MDETIDKYIELTHHHKRLYVNVNRIIYLMEISRGTQIRFREQGCVDCDEHIEIVMARIRSQGD